MTKVETLGCDASWGQYPAEEWADALLAAMKLGGVEHLYFVSGTEMSFFQEAAAKARALGRPAPKLMTMMHETVALMSALGESMVSNRPAATAVHVDVGTLHYGAGVHAAWRSGAPILMMAGTAPRAFPGSMRGGRDSNVQWMQEPRDQGAIVRQYTKMDHRLEHQDNPGMMVSRLLQVAMSEQTGPVYLSVPRESAMLPMPGATRFPTRDELGLSRPTWPDPEDARTIARWLVKSSNPLVIAERMGRDPQAVAELVRLAELLALPVMETRQADRLNFPMTHDLYDTGPQVRDADAVLVMDSVSPYLPGLDSPKPDAHIAWISPDPVLSRVKTLEFRADLRIAATAVNVLKAIHEAAEKMLDKGDLARIAERRKRLADRKRETVARDEQRGQEAGKSATPSTRWVAYQLGKLLEPSTILLNDGVSSGAAIRTYAKRVQPLTHFRSGSSAGGWAPGAAFGAKIAAPERDVVLAGGDGFYAFGTPSSALWAARRHKAPFLSVVFCNSAYSTGTTGLAGMYPDGYAVKADCEGGTFEPAPDFSKIAESAGAYGENVTETAEVGPALARGLAHVRNGVAAVIAVRVPSPMQERGA